MRKQGSFLSLIFAAAILACLPWAAFAQTSQDSDLANVLGGGSSVRWNVVAANAGVVLTISTPDGRALRREYPAGTSPEFTIPDKQLDNLPDGVYHYELRLSPVLSAAFKKKAQEERARDEDSEVERMARKRTVLPGMVESGSFSILNGQIIVAGLLETQRSAATQPGPSRSPSVISENTRARLRNHRLFMGVMPDQVFVDDIIIQASECVGAQCVNGETFGFDTIRMKEDNTRIQFTDTSNTLGYATNNWQIRANSSDSGGADFLAFVDQNANGDSLTGTIVFSVNAGAPAHALKVGSTGLVGIRTATPALDLHIVSSNTPAHRLEQTNAGGFTAQTWDVAGNETNFFVRDATYSRYPFRIRPGAPTSSIDITAAGNVGIGTASAGFKLQVVDNSASTPTYVKVQNGTNFTASDFAAAMQFSGVLNSSTRIGNVGMDRFFNSSGTFALSTDAAGGMVFSGNNTSIHMNVLSNGNVGIGTTAPTQLLSVNGTAGKPGGGTWDVFSDERLKNIKGRFNTGLKALMQLQPIRYEYKSNNPLGIKSEGENIGFGAQSLQKIIPEAVTRDSSGYLMVKSDPILWTMLNAIKEQQKEIAELKGQVRRLQARTRRHKK